MTKTLTKSLNDSLSNNFLFRESISDVFDKIVRMPREKKFVCRLSYNGIFFVFDELGIKYHISKGDWAACQWVLCIEKKSEIGYEVFDKNESINGKITRPVDKKVLWFRDMFLSGSDLEMEFPE